MKAATAASLSRWLSLVAVGLFDRRQQQRPALDEELVEDLVLGAEVVVDEPVGDPGLVGDVGDARLVEALAGEDADGGVEDHPAFVERRRALLEPRHQTSPAPARARRRPRGGGWRAPAATRGRGPGRRGRGRRRRSPRRRARSPARRPRGRRSPSARRSRSAAAPCRPGWGRGRRPRSRSPAPAAAPPSGRGRWRW